VHGELRAAVLRVKQRGQRADEGLVTFRFQDSGQLVTEPGQPREVLRGDLGQDGGIPVVGEHAVLPAQQPGRAERPRAEGGQVEGEPHRVQVVVIKTHFTAYRIVCFGKRHNRVSRLPDGAYRGRSRDGDGARGRTGTHPGGPVGAR
jgi:hypothetical protein